MIICFYIHTYGSWVLCWVNISKKLKKKKFIHSEGEIILLLTITQDLSSDIVKVKTEAIWVDQYRCQFSQYFLFGFRSSLNLLGTFASNTHVTGFMTATLSTSLFILPTLKVVFSIWPYTQNCDNLFHSVLLSLILQDLIFWFTTFSCSFHQLLSHIFIIICLVLYTFLFIFLTSKKLTFVRMFSQE